VTLEDKKLSPHKYIILILNRIKIADYQMKSVILNNIGAMGKIGFYLLGWRVQ
jgi:hypothetical protein